MRLCIPFVSRQGADTPGNASRLATRPAVRGNAAKKKPGLFPSRARGRWCEVQTLSSLAFASAAMMDGMIGSSKKVAAIFSPWARVSPCSFAMAGP